MKIFEFKEKYGDIPEGATICDPSTKPELFFTAPAKDRVADSFYQSANLDRVEIVHGQRVYFPVGTSLELNEERTYFPLWEIYETENLGSDGKSLTVRFYRIEEVYPDDYDGDFSSIRREKVYL